MCTALILVKALFLGVFIASILTTSCAFLLTNGSNHTREGGKGLGMGEDDIERLADVLGQRCVQICPDTHQIFLI